MKKTSALLVLLLAIGFIFSSCAGNPDPVDDPVQTSQSQSQSQTQTQASPPVLGVRLSSRYFSPDGDGVDDTLTISLTCNSDVEIRSWSFEVFEPLVSNQVFFQWSGQGRPPASLNWDGKNSTGELVQSASDYTYTFKAANVQGGASEARGLIEIDVLIVRDGDLLRVQVPSILFGPNIGDFTGVTQDITAANDYVLRRIATTLNKFNTYQVRVEGHANPTAPTPAAREREHTLELIPLSEQRARTVMEYLISLGVARGRLSSFGIGGSRTIVPYEDHPNWWKNRRVEFILVK